MCGFTCVLCAHVTRPNAHIHSLWRRVFVHLVSTSQTRVAAWNKTTLLLSEYLAKLEILLLGIKLS